jgi:N-acetylneuraminate synthase
MTYLDYKKKIEFDHEEYGELFDYCRKKKIKMFASVWDKDSVDFMKNYTDIMKVPSALINDIELIEYTRKNSSTFMISTGMSTEEEVENAVGFGIPDIIFHTNSSYPSPIDDLNLGYITWLREKYYPVHAIGYSGHEFGLTTTYAAVVMGAEWIERHITLDRTMWGSDQMASIEPTGMIKLVKGIRDIDKAIINGYGPREVLKSELSKRSSLRK